LIEPFVFESGIIYSFSLRSGAGKPPDQDRKIVCGMEFVGTTNHQLLEDGGGVLELEL
jgi:hypothetical protein